MGRIASRVVPHHDQVRIARYTRTCSEGGRPILDGTMSAQAARQGDLTQYYRQSETVATDLMQ